MSLTIINLALTIAAFVYLADVRPALTGCVAADRPGGDPNWPRSLGWLRVGEMDTRPWGSWQVLDEGDGFKVKRITVKPGARLSYQTHEHRAEHWVVAKGRATCVIDGETMVAT